MFKSVQHLMRIVVVGVIIQESYGYSVTAGNCNGLYGVHIPNSDGGGDGGYTIKLTNSSASDTVTGKLYTGTVAVTFQQPGKGSGTFRGFLIKSFDPYTGQALGNFIASSLPANTMLYEGCNPSSSAVSHSMNVPIQDLKLPFTWPAGQDIAFQLFIVELENKWFEVRTMFHSSFALSVSVRDPVTYCPPEVSPAAAIIAFIPVILLIVGVQFRSISQF